MSALNHKIDFVALVNVTNANPNGDPLGENQPRTDYDGFGLLSDVCIKRKIRNRMQDMGQRVFVQSQERCDDGFDSLSKRAEATLKGEKDRAAYAEKANATWVDVRAFGQVFAFKGGVSVGVRGPVTIHQALSVAPIDAPTMQITKSVNSEPTGDGKKSSDTMGVKHYVRHGLYVVKGSINVQLAKLTGFSDDDAQVVKEALRTLFRNDASSARPEGSMEVKKLYWFIHNNQDGQYATAEVHRSVKVQVKEGVSYPKSYEDYNITLDQLDGLQVEVLEGE